MLVPDHVFLLFGLRFLFGEFGVFLAGGERAGKCADFV